MRGRIALALGLLWLTAACDAPPKRPSAGTVVRDSSGVRIVETSATERFSALWEIGEFSDWSVGELEGDPDYLLTRVVGALQLPGGRIAVGNGDTNEVRISGPDGARAPTLGGHGQGSGEFQRLRALRQWAEVGFEASDRTGRSMPSTPMEGRLSLVTLDDGVQTDFGSWLASERIGTMGGSGPHPARPDSFPIDHFRTRAYMAQAGGV